VKMVKRSRTPSFLSPSVAKGLNQHKNQAMGKQGRVGVTKSPGSGSHRPRGKR
jgi:hypothetical protein